MIFPEIAYAQSAPAAAQGGVMITILPLLIMIAVFYFLVMRPQIKREQARQQMRSDLKRNDNVITTGGLVGKITKLEDDHYILVKLAEGTEVRLARASVEGVVETGIPAAKKPATKTTRKTSGKSTGKSSKKKA